jgi:hypothetical protein
MVIFHSYVKLPGDLGDFDMVNWDEKPWTMILYNELGMDFWMAIFFVVYNGWIHLDGTFPQWFLMADH